MKRPKNEINIYNLCLSRLYHGTEKEERKIEIERESIE